MTDEEVAKAQEMLNLSRILAESDSLLARRAGERIAIILTDLIYEHDPWSGLPDHTPRRETPDA